MDDALRHELSAAQNPEDKAAIIAEVLFSTLPEETATLARRCSLLHWFDEAIFEALAEEIPLSRSETKDFYEQFGHFPMVETLPWGLAFNKLTREGLLRRYTQRQPELLRTAARLAAPAYQARRQDRRALSEAFFCLIVAGNTISARGLLTELLQQAATRGDWEYIARLLRMQGEAERLPFAQPLLPPIAYQAVQFFADKVLTQAFIIKEERTSEIVETVLRLRREEERRRRKAQEEEAARKTDSPRQSPVWPGVVTSPSPSAQRSMAVQPLDTPRPTKHGFSRRAVLVGLAGLLLVLVLSGVGGYVVISLGNPCGSCSYTLTWNPVISGFPNVDLTLTPIVPPKPLSLKPTDYAQVPLTVGKFSFSTDDPAYQCLEADAATALPIILAPENEVISGFGAINDFLIVYQACGKFVQTSHANLASLGGMAAKQLIFFRITGQKMVSRAADGQEYTPFGPVFGTIPTPTPPTPPMLSVMPGNFNTGEHCSSNGFHSWVCSEELTNTGGGTLNWTASNSDDAEIRPSRGTLSAGQSTMLVIDFACDSVNFTLTFSGPTNTVVARVQVTNRGSCH